MNLQEIDLSINFTNEIRDKISDNLDEVLLFVNLFNEIYLKEIDNLPYHINLIDELNADENAHSRILAKLLRYEKNKQYPFLEKFLNEVCKFDLKIIKPEIKKVDSCGRIDIPIFDEEYVVVIENKVTDQAPDQNKDNGGQLARYIETIIQHKKNLNQIYVVYTPKYTREPSVECWINKDGFSYKDKFKDRFCSKSYRDEIYPWLKGDVLPSIDEKDTYLRSAIEQYVDYLEGEKMFNLRNKEMNMNIQKFLKEKLEINNAEPDLAMKIVAEKLQEMEYVIGQLNSMQDDLQNEIDEKFFSKCYQELKELDLKVTREINNFKSFSPNSVGVILNNKITAWLGKAKGLGTEVFCQVNYDDIKNVLPEEIKQKFQQILKEEKIEFSKDGHQIWAWIKNTENALFYLKEICKEISNI